jgi:hypothetical protein
MTQLDLNDYQFIEKDSERNDILRNNSLRNF